MQVDSNYKSLDEALQGLDFPKEIRDSLALVDVAYLSFDGQKHQGQLVVHQHLVRDIQNIFNALLEYKFPIHKVVPIVAYDGDDTASMEDNNSSAFNYRHIIGTNLYSSHSYGRAIDINPRQNPYYARDGKNYPAGASHDASVPGTFTKDGGAVAIFKAKGWTWLGEREEYKDFQHFEKR